MNGRVDAEALGGRRVGFTEELGAAGTRVAKRNKMGALPGLTGHQSGIHTEEGEDKESKAGSRAKLPILRPHGPWGTRPRTA